MSYFSQFPKVAYPVSAESQSFKIAPNILAKATFLDSVFDNASFYFPYSVKDGEMPEDIAYRLYGDAKKHWIILLSNKIVDPQYDWVLDNRSFREYMDIKYSSYVLTLDPDETYANNYIVGEVAYQGADTIDKSSMQSKVVAYDSVNKKLTVNFIDNTIATSEPITGADSDVSHGVIGVSKNSDGFEWSSNTTRHFLVTETQSNSYDRTTTKKTYIVSAKDYNHATNSVVDRNTNTTTTSTYQLVDGTTLTVERNTAPVTHFDYELQLNESRRRIRLVRPEYISRIEEQFNQIMKV
jgi:hypothetical protein